MDAALFLFHFSFDVFLFSRFRFSFFFYLARLGFYNQNEKSIPLWLSVFFSLSVLDSLYSKSPAFLFDFFFLICTYIYFFYILFILFFFRQHRTLKAEREKKRQACKVCERMCCAVLCLRSYNLSKFYCGHSILFWIGELEYQISYFGPFHSDSAVAACYCCCEYISHLTISINLNRWVYCV